MQVKIFSGRNTEDGRILLECQIEQWVTKLNIARLDTKKARPPPRIEISAIAQSHPTPADIVITVVCK